MPYYQAGDIILRDYKIEAFIGQGGFGEVYRAVDLNLHETVALKILRRSTGMEEGYYDRARDRFTLEARLGHRITHPNIIRIYKFAPDETSGLLVLVMEYASGGSLADKMKSGPLEVSDVLQIARQVAAGLSALHEQDVVHRDLKPSNILFDAYGIARVADLGLAQPASVIQVSGSSSGGGEWQTQPGTPAYMSPEQDSGRLHDLPPASDIYALGLIIFEMLTGRMYKSQPPGTRLSKLCSGIPAALDNLLSQMLSEDPSRRPWDGQAVEKKLSKLLKKIQKSSEGSPITKPVIARILLVTGGLMLLVGLSLSFPWLMDRLLGNVPTIVEPTPKPTETSDISMLPACTQIGQTWISPVDGMTMVCVPAGNFLMGSTDADQFADADEKPQHTVYLDAYWIDQTEVTNAMFAKFVTATGYTTTAEQEGSGYAYTGSVWAWIDGADWQHPSGPDSDLVEKMNHPVVQISWYDAEAYCEWARRKLPSEAQWEKAARGTDGRLYPWGNDFLCKNGNFDDETQIETYTVPGGPDCDGYANTAPVGSYLDGASLYGALDMAGNVWEWTADWYDNNYYSSQTTWKNPVGPNNGEYRVVRGGSWYNGPGFERTAIRVRLVPEYRFYARGFRCLLDATP